MLYLLLVLVAWAGPALVDVSRVDPGQAEALFEGRRLALLVGPEGFDDEGFAALSYTDDDARALGQALRTTGGFDETLVLTSKDQTRAVSIRGAMSRISAMARSRDDTVVVYFSTHGTLARGADGVVRQYLVPSDGRLADVPATAISHDEVLSWLESLPSRKKVLVLASCHSGRGKSVLPDPIAAELATTKGASLLPPLFDVSEALIVIGVCAWNETARESASLGHDIYTWFLLQALMEGDLDGDGAVTITEAHDYARRYTYAYTDGAQRAFARADILGTDPVVLAGTRSGGGAATLGSYSGRLAGYSVRIDGAAKGTLPGLVTVEPGVHRLEVLDGDKVVARQRFSAREGTAVDVSTLVRHDRLRAGGGLGYHWLSADGAGGPALWGEVQLPGLPGNFELVAHGSPVIRLDRPTLSGGLDLERAVLPGTLQLRAGLRVSSFVLQRAGDPDFMAPAAVPGPVLSLAWLPRQPVYARLSLAGGYMGYAEAGAWQNGWAGTLSLAAGGAF